MEWRSGLIQGILYFNYFVLWYFIALNGIYLILFLASLGEVIRFLRRTFAGDYKQILASDMTWPISVVVPAHNEEKTIVDTVRSLLMLNYGQFEIIVVNDGSNDGTLKRLIEAFELRRLDRVYRPRPGRSGPTPCVRASLVIQPKPSPNPDP